jgi:hypothetical protein
MIDHSTLSPSGYVSARCRKATTAKARAELQEYFDTLPRRPAETVEERRQAMLRTAKELRGLAARGMSPRKHIKAAQDIESRAALLEVT